MSSLKSMLTREQVVGLDINDGQITAAWFQAGNLHAGLKNIVCGEYSPGVDDRHVAKAIREIWRKEKIPTRTVQSCLHSRSLLIRYFKYENISREELPRVLSLEAEEALQCPIDEISLDWQLNTELPSNSNAQKLSGTLVAAPRHKVLRHLKLIKMAGLYSVNVHVSYSALNNLYSWLMKEQDTEPVCLINLTQSSVDIVMHSDNSNYPRTLFSAETGWEHNGSYLLENIQNALLYYHLKLKHAPIKRIFLAGRLSGLDEFKKNLSEETSLPVSELDMSSILKINNKFLAGDRARNQATAIGLGLKREVVQ
ncbi:type IV pilus biogenesis protein PilM [Tichowtungia aerotolerans]|uniref:Pilus assembly protein PilM n=1 Tax=Tichowtungia aerotolerans TaxID=2697043 RepID=A0A6P1M6U0_9BACT|nr:pilus assembly protein PilM [Tichowtungia aerotolerans]QHI70509.1 pilus assembly protein PilM [Tichowtungia aerotolerans]